MSAIRIVVTGLTGQIAQSLLERARGIHNIEVLTLGRPQIDLEYPDGIAAELAKLQPQVIVCAAGYTAVDQAESDPEVAYAVNAIGAGAVARSAAQLGVPVIHLSTDYVFAGDLDRPYIEADLARPKNIYGWTKLEGEQAVARANPNHVILRTSWVYSPFGKNFARTMLGLAERRQEISVVSDQVGSPTSALDVADGIISVSRNLLENPDASELRGIFHMTAHGHTSWAGFATELLLASARLGGPRALVLPIPTSAYPTPACRPANSRLDNAKIIAIHQVRLPNWRASLPGCIGRLIAASPARSSSHV